MCGDWRYLKYLVFTVVCVVTRPGHTATSQCSSAYGTTLTGQRLEGYVFRTLDNTGTKQCARECFTRPSCLSFNYHTNRTCELNTDSDSGQSGSFTPYTDYTYSRIDTWSGFSGACNRSTCAAGQKCVDLTHTTACVYTECMERPLFGVMTSTETGVEGQSFPATCKAGYEPRGTGTNVTCAGGGLWEITSSYCYRTFSSDWMLMARFGSGNGDAVYDTWLETGRDDNKDAHMPDECKETNTSNVCTRHFRNGLIDDWDILNPIEVRFSLYKAGVEVVYALLNATDTNPTSWFAKGRLLSTSFTDLKKNSTTNHFSAFGLVYSTSLRRFYIHQTFGTCETDSGWVQVLDSNGLCSYEDDIAIPQFLYSKNNVVGNIETETLAADVLAIFLKM